MPACFSGSRALPLLLNVSAWEFRPNGNVLPMEIYCGGEMLSGSRIVFSVV